MITLSIRLPSIEDTLLRNLCHNLTILWLLRRITPLKIEDVIRQISPLSAHILRQIKFFLEGAPFLAIVLFVRDIALGPGGG